MATIDIDVAAAQGFDEILSPSQQPQKNTALANTLSRVLVTSFADGEIREALHELDARQLQNTAETRRRLRTDIQKEVIDCNGDIIKDFGVVAARLKRIGATIASLQACCDDMRQHITAAQREAAPVLEEASTLTAQQKETATKQQLLAAFQTHFLLSEKDLEVLTSSAEPVDGRFFSLLSRLQGIHADCEVLLGENQQLGLELLDQSSKQLDSAFQKLVRWVEREFKTLDLENPRMGAHIRRALGVLAARPALFEGCLDAFAASRERHLADAFYTALTGFSAAPENRGARPMDMHAYDALRFAGDMLAWTHAAAVSEREALEVLFVGDGDAMARGIQAGRESEPWRAADTAFDGPAALVQLVNRDLASVARALRQRVEQTIRADADAVLAYKLCSLLDFYRLTFDRLLGGDVDRSPLLTTLATLQDVARSHFTALMQDHVAAIPPDAAVDPPTDLGPPAFVADALDRLTQIAQSHDGSFLDPTARTAAFEPTLALALDPYLTACLPGFRAAASTATAAESEDAAEESDTPDLEPGLPDPAGSVYALNVLRSALAALTPWDFATERTAALRTARRALTARLTAHQHAAFRARSGLARLIDALAPLDPHDPADLATLPSLPVCAPNQLARASQALDAWLPEALVEAQEELRLLRDKRIAEEVTAEAAGRFGEDFDAVEECLIAADALAGDAPADAAAAGKEADGTGSSGRLRDLFPRTSAEIRVLLS